MFKYFINFFSLVHKFDLMNKSISLDSNTLLVYKLALSTLSELSTAREREQDPRLEHGCLPDLPDLPGLPTRRPPEGHHPRPYVSGWVG